MKYFIDESGDFGFGPTSPTQYIVVGCIKILKGKPVKKTIYRWEKELLKSGWRPDKEVKWYTALNHQRIEILRRLARLNFEFRCVYIKKSNVPSFLHNKSDVLYGYMVSRLVSPILEPFIENHIFIDEKSKIAHNHFEYYLKIKTLCEEKKDICVHIHPARSEEVYCIRAVDFMTGAIRHSFDLRTNVYKDLFKDRILECREILK